ncbi:MAG: hypothetical protein SO072_00310 [Dysosmobacter sp.]|uniref:hypothetical protein n=1 Tax=Vescimonas sp. TaxID=2892404 RepID=UPI002A875590|nr:hypothetical protein [Vescimonas sp.]MDY3690391.1 hypothetical protein [Dysosmobacter sp.]MDY5334133.1 hypothetical protein [Vescimonas sp.]
MTTPDKRRGLFLFWQSFSERKGAAFAASGRTLTPYAKLTQKVKKIERKICGRCKAVFGGGLKNGFFVKQLSFLRYKNAKFTKICLQTR